MVANDQSDSYIIDALRILENLICIGKKKVGKGKRDLGQPTQLSSENHQLRNRTHQLETEWDILRRSPKKALRTPRGSFSAGLPQLYDLIGQLSDEFAVIARYTVSQANRTDYYTTGYPAFLAGEGDLPPPAKTVN